MNTAVNSGRSSRAIILFAIASLPPVVWLCHIYVGLEDPPLYVWDFANYWNKFIEYGALISSGSDWISRAQDSVRQDDYNPIAAILIYPGYLFGGGTRASYISTLCIVYLVPVAALSGWLAMRLTQLGHRAAEASTAFILALSYVPYWAPTMRGMVDIAGLIPLGLATWLILDAKATTQYALYRPILIGVLLWLAFLLRRWYAYSVVALFAVFLLLMLVQLQRVRWIPISVVTHLAPLALAGLVFLALALTFQWDLVIRVIETDYSEIYSAYASTLFDQLRVAINRLGLYGALLITIGAIVAVMQRILGVLICLLAACLSFLLFIQTQGMGTHHFLPIAFWMFPAYVLGFRFLVDQASRYCQRWIAAAAFLGISVFAFIYSLFPLGVQVPGALARALPVQVTHPLRLENRSGYDRLAADLRILSDETDRIVVLASSMVLSDLLFTNVAPDLEDRLIRVPHNGVRDDLSLELIRGDWLIVTDPAQTHLAPTSQTHIAVPNNQLLRNEGVGRAFDLAAEPYDLGHGVTAKLYRRERPIQPDEIRALSSEIERLMTSRSTSPATRLSAALALRDETLGDRYGTVRYLGLNRFAVHPGATTPTRIELPVVDGFILPREIQVSVRDAGTRCPDADGATVALQINDQTVLFREVAKGGTETMTIPKIESRPVAENKISVIVGNNENPACDFVTVHFLA